jgi:hypothetical protein
MDSCYFNIRVSNKNGKIGMVGDINRAKCQKSGQVPAHNEFLIVSNWLMLWQLLLLK